MLAQESSFITDVKDRVVEARAAGIGIPFVDSYDNMDVGQAGCATEFLRVGSRMVMDWSTSLP